MVVDEQRLHVEAQLAVAPGARGRAVTDDLSATDARARVSADARTFKGPQIEVPRVEGLTIPGAAGPIGARLYVPGRYGREADAPDGLLVYFHGGGFVVGDLETHDNVCRFLARQSGVRVMAVDYRLAPEHRFPAAIDDAHAAFRFAVELAAELGADPTALRSAATAPEATWRRAWPDSPPLAAAAPRRRSNCCSIRGF